MLEKLSSDTFLDPRGGVDNLFEIRALNYFCGHLPMMLNFHGIVPRNVYACGSKDHEGQLYVIIFLDIKGEGDTASQDKNFSKICLQNGLRCIIKLNFTYKNPELC